MPLLSLLLCSLVVLGCAAPNASRSTVSHTQLAPDVFRIASRGNGAAAPQRVQDFAFLRAAELTLRSGYTHFTVVTERTGSTAQTIEPLIPLTTTNGTATRLGTQTVYSSNTVSSVPTHIVRPDASLTIRCSNKPSAGALDAAFVANSIRRKYRLDAR